LEVLVVIGIIFVLVALSVPAIQSFISKSRSVGCQSSLRQLYIGAVSFAGDNNGAIPYNYQGGWWIRKIDDEYAIPPSDKSPMDLMCPGSPRANGKQVAPRFGPANYGMNCMLACTLNNDGTVTASYGGKNLSRLSRFTDLAAPAPRKSTLFGICRWWLLLIVAGQKQSCHTNNCRKSRVSCSRFS